MEENTEIPGPAVKISRNINPEAGSFVVEAGAFEIVDNAKYLSNSFCRLSKENCGF